MNHIILDSATSRREPLLKRRLETCILVHTAESIEKKDLRKEELDGEKRKNVPIALPSNTIKQTVEPVRIM
jgi:hypothetical protein